MLNWETIGEAVLDALIDSAKMLPILFLTYLIIEYVEHHMSRRMEHLIRKTGRLGPLVGSAVGIIPQCGFSGAAAGLYAARGISVGTLFAIILTTSDEMLPILLSEHVPLPTVLTILGLKFGVGLAVGFAVDLILWNRHRVEVSEGLGPFSAERAEMHRHGVLEGAIRHTLTIILMIFAVSAMLNIVFELIGEEAVAAWLPDLPFAGEALAALLGLIPNCSASVFLTDLYVSGVIGIGPMMAGLLVNGGVGLLVLWRCNRDKKENLLITAALYGVSVVVGTMLGFIPGL